MATGTPKWDPSHGNRMATATPAGPLLLALGAADASPALRSAPLAGSRRAVKQLSAGFFSVCRVVLMVMTALVAGGAVASPSTSSEPVPRPSRGHVEAALTVRARA